MRLLNHGENTVYGVRRRGQSERYILRLHRPGYHPPDDLRSEAAFLDHLRDAGLEVPTPLRTAEGDAIAQVTTPGIPEGRWCSLLLKVPGAMHPVSAWGPTRARAAGRLLARMHGAAATFRASESFTRRTLDGPGLVGPNACWGNPLAEPTLTPEQRALFTWGRDTVLAETARWARTPDVWGPTHTDLHQGNVLFHGGAARAIDFDDLAFSWYLSDFAVNLVPLRWVQPRSADLLLDAYAALRPLPKGLHERLGLIHVGRRLTAVAWLRSRSDVPRLLSYLPARIRQPCRTIEALRAGEDPLDVRPEPR